MQERLIEDSLPDALRAVVAALGGAKAVGARMRPEISPDDAGRWLSRCLNPERDEKLSLDQLLLVLKWAREANCHMAMAFIAELCGYEARPVEPQDELPRLYREFIQATQLQAELAKRIERLGAITVVHEKRAA